MQKKNDEQNLIMDKLTKASEFIQAHWRGMQERKLMEKAMKGKRKKKKGKKRWKNIHVLICLYSI